MSSSGTYQIQKRMPGRINNSMTSRHQDSSFRSRAQGTFASALASRTKNNSQKEVARPKPVDSTPSLSSSIWAQGAKALFNTGVADASDVPANHVVYSKQTTTNATSSVATPLQKFGRLKLVNKRLTSSDLYKHAVITQTNAFGTTSISKLFVPSYSNAPASTTTSKMTKLFNPASDSNTNVNKQKTVPDGGKASTTKMTNLLPHALDSNANFNKQPKPSPAEKAEDCWKASGTKTTDRPSCAPVPIINKPPKKVRFQDDGKNLSETKVTKLPVAPAIAVEAKQTPSILPALKDFDWSLTPRTGRTFNWANEMNEGEEWF